MAYPIIYLYPSIFDSAHINWCPPPRVRRPSLPQNGRVPLAFGLTILLSMYKFGCYGSCLLKFVSLPIDNTHTNSNGICKSGPKHPRVRAHAPQTLTCIQTTLAHTHTHNWMITITREQKWMREGERGVFVHKHRHSSSFFLSASHHIHQMNSNERNDQMRNANTIWWIIRIFPRMMTPYLCVAYVPVHLHSKLYSIRTMRAVVSMCACLCVR